MEKEQSSHSSKKPFYKKAWFWVVIVLVIIGVGAAGASSQKDPKKVSSGDDKDSSSQQTPKTDAPSTFKIGDVVSIDDHKVSVNEVQHGYTAKYTQPAEGKEFILIRFEIQNDSDEKISCTSANWKMEDSNGNLDTNAIMASGEDDNLSLSELMPGGKKTASLVFEVPIDDPGLKIHYIPNMFLDREAVIKL